MEEYITEVAGSLLVDGGKKAIGMVAKRLLDRNRLEQIFVKAGSAVSSYEREKTEENELRAIVFCEDNMKQLAKAMWGENEFRWEETLECFLDNLLNASAMSEKNKNRCKRHFTEIVRSDMENCFEQVMERTYLRESRDNSVEILGQISNCEQVLQQIVYGIRKLSAEQGESDGHRERQEKSDRPKIDLSGQNKNGGELQAEWKLKSLHIKGIFEPKEKHREEILELTAQWRREREEYPDWYIIPWAVRERLRWNTKEVGLLQQKNLVSLSERVEFCYEYVWRMERGMFLYDYRIQKNIRDIWEDYGQLLRTAGGAGDTSGEVSTNVVTEELSAHWFYIGQALLREYREDGVATDWQSVYSMLKQHVDFTPGGAEELNMEAVKYAFSVMDIGKAIRELKKWNIPKAQFTLRLQAIGILAECGELEEARQKITELKEDMRQSLTEAEGSYRLFIKTLHAGLLQLESLMLQGYAHWKGEYEQYQEEINGVVEQIEKEKQYFDWQEFLSYETKELLNGYVKRNEVKEPFELNRENKTIMESVGDEGDAAYCLYRVLDALAVPLQINHVTLMSRLELPWINALMRINTRLAMFMMIRGSHGEVCKKLLQRRYLSGLKQSEVTGFIRFLIDVLNKNLEEIATERGFSEGNIYSAIEQNVPEMLCRFMSRCPEYLQKEALLLLKRMMENGDLILAHHMNDFILGMMKQISERVKAQMLGTLMNTGIFEHATLSESRIAIDIFDYYFVKSDFEVHKVNCRVEQEQIEELFACPDTSLYVWRTKIARLEILYQMGLLNDEQTKRFATLIWSRLNSRNLPDVPNRYVWSYMKLPHEGRNAPALSIKDFILQGGLVKFMKTEGGRSVTMGEIRYLDELIAMSQGLEKDFWSVKEVEQIFEDAIAFWKVLYSKFAHVYSDFMAWEYRRRAGKIVRALAEVYNSITGVIDFSVQESARQMLREMATVGVEGLQLAILFSDDAEIVEQIREQLYATEDALVVDAILAAYTFIQKYPLDERAVLLLEELIHMLRMGKRRGVVSVLYVLHNLVYISCEIITDEILEKIDKHLQKMEQVTQYENYRQSNEKEVKEVISIRKACVALAFQMYGKLGEKCGEGVRLWKAVAEGEEFAEVKNEWYC